MEGDSGAAVGSDQWHRGAASFYQLDFVTFNYCNDSKNLVNTCFFSAPYSVHFSGIGLSDYKSSMYLVYKVGDTLIHTRNNENENIYNSTSHR